MFYKKHFSISIVDCVLNAFFEIFMPNMIGKLCYILI